MMVAALVFGAVGGVLVVSLRATLAGRQAQQAADLATRTVERLRNRDYATLGMSAADAATDPAITASGYAVPLPNGSTSTEPIVLAATSPVNPHVTWIELDGTRFTVARYVTVPPADATNGATYKRVTVVVSWLNGSRSRSRSTSTLVTLTRRGLPAPAFNVRVTAPPSVSRLNGVLTVGVAVTNLGVRSRWMVTTKTTVASSTTDRLWSFKWYSDNGATGPCNGVRDADEPAAPQSGTADTGLIASEATGCLIGEYTVRNSEPQGPYTLAVTAAVTTAAGLDTTQSGAQMRTAQFMVQ